LSERNRDLLAIDVIRIDVIQAFAVVGFGGSDVRSKEIVIVDGKRIEREVNVCPIFRRDHGAIEIFEFHGVFDSKAVFANRNKRDDGRVERAVDHRHERLGVDVRNIAVVDII